MRDNRLQLACLSKPPLKCVGLPLLLRTSAPKGVDCNRQGSVFSSATWYDYARDDIPALRDRNGVANVMGDDSTLLTAVFDVGQAYSSSEMRLYVTKSEMNLALRKGSAPTCILLPDAVELVTCEATVDAGVLSADVSSVPSSELVVRQTPQGIEDSQEMYDTEWL